MNLRIKTMALACGLALVGAAQAVLPLEGRTLTGHRVDAYDASAVMIYDPNADLTWLRDWNVNGAKTWQDQLVWAGSLNVGAFANWSLPTSRNQDGSGPCVGFNCTGSQMGYMWYEVLGNTAGSFTNAGPFQNVQSYAYWSGTEDAWNPYHAWLLSTSEGDQRYGYKGSAMYAVAVRPGDVPVIPEPQTYAMLLLGLAGVMVAVRRRAG